ncbi:restriction endonuclease subunit S [Staphylococcus aureus]|nr:restriction endonuclease subunit S [Staphylococcus aureus]
MSNTQTKNVPELRFPGFEGEWEEKKLGNLTTKIGSGKTPKGGSENYTNKGIPFLRSQNIRNGKLNLNDLVYISKDIDDEMKNSRTYYGDVLLNITGASIGRTAINSIVETHANLNQHVCIIRLKKEYYYNFFGQYLLSRKGKRKIFLAQSGGSREGLNFKEIANLKIFTPTIFEEQQKIGKFFSKLDRQIELEEQKLELLQQQKKGYMQKIFTQELRFKDENGEEYPEWENKFIKDIFIFENNRRKPITSSLREKGLYPYYGATGIIDYVKDYLFNNEERLLIGEDGAKWGQFETSSFIANGQYWVNNHAHVVKSNDHNLFFMNYYLNFKELRAFVTSNAPAKLTHANLCNINLKIPCLTEQDKVSALLKSIDNKMNNQMNRIELLKERKKGLLQKMFI